MSGPFAAFDRPRESPLVCVMRVGRGWGSLAFGVRILFSAAFSAFECTEFAAVERKGPFDQREAGSKGIRRTRSVRASEPSIAHYYCVRERASERPRETGTERVREMIDFHKRKKSKSAHGGGERVGDGGGVLDSERGKRLGLHQDKT